MGSLGRREAIRILGTGAIVALAGCHGNRGDEPSPTLRLSPSLELTETGWRVTVRVRHKTDSVASIHDVTVLGFSDHGESVCQVNVGDFTSPGEFEATESVTCEDFPAIITATARESPCDGAQIELLYYVGGDEQRDSGSVNDGSLWEGNYRKCDEEVPPEHVVSNVTQRRSGRR